MGFQVNEEVRMGLGFDWAVVTVKRSRKLGNECDEKERILWNTWDERSDL